MTNSYPLTVKLNPTSSDASINSKLPVAILSKKELMLVVVQVLSNSIIFGSELGESEKLDGIKFPMGLKNVCVKFNELAILINVIVICI